jgi:hypothetical protein
MTMSKTQALVVAVVSTFVILLSEGVIVRAHDNDRGEAKATVGNAKVTIEYGRPNLKGRDITQMIAPGHLWRIGADAPTTIESTADLEFGGTRVPKGKHILLARLIAPGKWSLTVSTRSASTYEPSAKLAEVPMEFTQVIDPIEELTISLTAENGHGVIEIAWGTARLKVTFNQAG